MDGRRSRRSHRLSAPLAVAALLLSGCGAGDDVAGPVPDGATSATGFGEPAAPSAATRTVEVTVGDGYTFTPDRWQVSAGEVVTFELVNTGTMEHEFVLGDEAAQERMAEEMASMQEHAHGHATPNAVTVHGGGSASLTWRFPDQPTQVLVGCHLPGHYDAGMRGVIDVS